MKKRAIAAILAVVVMASSICACAAQSGQAKAEETAKETEAAAAEADAPEGAEAAEKTAAEEGAATEAEEVKTEAETEPAVSEEKAENGPVPVFTLEEHNFHSSDTLEGENVTFARGTFEAIRLTDEAKAAYPALDLALGTFDEEQSKLTREAFEEVLEAAETFLNDYNEELINFSSGEMSMKIEPVRCDRGILSFFYSNSSYYPGAAHGLLGYGSCNFITATGEPVALTDVVTDLSALAPAVAKNLTAIADGSPVEDTEDQVKEYFDQNSESLVWVLDRDGIVFRFAPYELAPYAMGTLESRITFAENPDLFTGKYTAVKGAFTRYLEPFRQNMLDINGDGKAEHILMDGVYDIDADLFAYTGIELDVDQSGCMEEAYFYEMKAVLMHTEDGRNYVYAQTGSDNDYTTLYLFEITDDGPYSIDKLDGMGFASSFLEDDDASDAQSPYEQSGYANRYVVLDPSRFVLNKQTNLMSTYDATREYGVGEDGMTVPHTDYYEINGKRVLTSLQSMEVDLVDPATGELTGETAELPEGTGCTLWHTNGEDTVDLLMEDGRAFRVEVSGSWPQTVNGIDLEKAFEGTMFAG